jgi:DNA-binding CsgD family transcriptional regulator
MGNIMPSLPPDKEESLFKRPIGALIDEEQWLFLKDRYHLTQRGLQVAILTCRGFSNDEVAKSLDMKRGTVKTHLRNIYRRTRVTSKILLLLRFIEDINKHCVTSQNSPLFADSRLDQLKGQVSGRH